MNLNSLNLVFSQFEQALADAEYTGYVNDGIKYLEKRAQSGVGIPGVEIAFITMVPNNVSAQYMNEVDQFTQSTEIGQYAELARYEIRQFVDNEYNIPSLVIAVEGLNQEGSRLKVNEYDVPESEASIVLAAMSEVLENFSVPKG
jgi:hypothetical protein